MGSPASLARFVSRLGPRAQLISTLRALRAFTGTSRTPPGYPSPSPHRHNEYVVVQEYQPVVHRLRMSASP